VSNRWKRARGSCWRKPAWSRTCGPRSGWSTRTPPEPGIELARTPAPTIWRLITENEIIHAASLVCLLTHLGRDGRVG